MKNYSVIIITALLFSFNAIAQVNLVKDNGFENAFTRWDYHDEKEQAPLVPRVIDYTIWECYPDTFGNSYRTFKDMKGLIPDIMCNTKKYGYRFASGHSLIIGGLFNDPRNKIFYKFCKLTKPIKKGELVKGGFEYIYTMVSDIIVFNSGMLFTKDTPILKDRALFVLNKPQIMNKQHITRKGIWIPVRDSFIAQTDLEWVTIGIFADHSNWEIDLTNMKIYGKLKYEEIKNKLDKFMYQVNSSFDNVFVYTSTIEAKQDDNIYSYFEFGSPTLTNKQKDLLINKLKSIDIKMIKQIEIEGFTDVIGTNENNISLSTNRADNIKTILEEATKTNIPIKTVGRGIYENGKSNLNPSLQRVANIIIHYKN